MYQKPITETEDTIAAISTPVGEGGIGIVRMSGKDAFAIALDIFVPQSKTGKYPVSHRLYYGYIKDKNNEHIDEVLLSFMKAPGTYTREDIVEINCHSGAFSLKIILETVLEKGARLAEPGEFTKRAYLNGRIDLSQAESVLNIITARSEKAVKNAARLVKGELSSEIKNLRGIILSLLANIEASLDFPGEVEDINFDSAVKDLEYVNEKIKNLCRSAEKGAVFQEGLKVSIVGKPNVGKSSLLNSILHKQRAIVTEVPGTTRDILEEQLSLRGVPVCLIDTAGIRKTHDPVEKLGVNLSWEAIEAADLVLIMMDASTGMQDEDREILKIIKENHRKHIVVINKIDLNDKISDADLKEITLAENIIKISATKKTGIDELEKTIVALVEEDAIAESENIMITNMRHKDALLQAGSSIQQAIAGMENDPIDLISIDIKRTEEKLGMITGETVDDDVLDRIFARFCIGK